MKCGCLAISVPEYPWFRVYVLFRISFSFLDVIAGISHEQSVATELIGPFVQVLLDDNLQIMIVSNLNTIFVECSWKLKSVGFFRCEQDVLDGIEFARGPVDSTWGAVRAQMGHPEPFHLHHVAVGNEDCGLPYYKGSQNFQLVTVTDTMHDFCFLNDYN
jgi:hypothetical protein